MKKKQIVILCTSHRHKMFGVKVFCLQRHVTKQTMLHINLEEESVDAYYYTLNIYMYMYILV